MADQSPGVGHNSGDKPKIGGVAGEALSQFLERIERLRDEKQALQGDISDVFAQAKAQGFDCKIIRELLKLRKMDAAERQESFQLLELYGHATGLDIFS